MKTAKFGAKKRVNKLVVGFLTFLICITPLSSALAEESLYNISESAIINEIKSIDVVQEKNIEFNFEKQLINDKKKNNSNDPDINQILSLSDERKNQIAINESSKSSTQVANFSFSTASSLNGIIYKYPDPTLAVKLPQIQNNNGALTYDYAITIPPGRNGLQPNLTLSYNSNSSNQLDNFFGAGWSINIPYIQKINKRGVDKLYSTTTPVNFLSSIDGELATTTATSTYVARTDNGSFNFYTFTDNKWLMIDKNGTQYKFGYTASTQMYNTSSTNQIYKWMLQEIQDVNGNFIRYGYYKDSGQIYPSTIIYTGTSTADGIFEVDFLRENRPDITTTSAPGFNVTTNSRISEIDVKVNGAWVKKYVLSYATGGNGVKSLLNSITESGRDELSNITTLPSENFSYQSTASGWATTTSWHFPYPIIRENGSVNHSPFLNDLNGDALADVGVGTGGSAYLNTGSSDWATTTPAFDVVGIAGDGNRDYGGRIVDVNGDGLTDVLRGWKYFDAQASLVTGEYVYLNTGSGFATTSPTWHLPANFAFVNEYAYQIGAYVADVNGDGLPDLLNDQVYFNNGVNGWATTTPSWTVPVGFAQNNTLDPSIYLGDVNGDGLLDIVRLGPGGSTLYKNTGSGWVVDNTWTIPGIVPDSLYDWGARMIDLNGDGLPDFFRAWQEYQGSPPEVVNRDSFFINTGSGWTYNSNWHVPAGVHMVDLNLNPYGLQIGDYNGDGLPDLLRSWSEYDTGGGCCVYKNSEWVNLGARTDLLTNITYPTGGNTTVNYKPSTQYMNGSTILNPHLPMTVDVVNQITNSDGNGNNTIESYTYKNGTYYYNNGFDKQLSGFGEVDKVDEAGNVTKTFFHTSNGTDTAHGEYTDNFFKIGKLYRTEKYNNSGSLYHKTINKWEHAVIPNSEAGFVKLVQKIDFTYDGDATHADSAETYTYDDSNGNLIGKILWGEVNGQNDGSFSDIGKDKIITNYTYATDAFSIKYQVSSEISVDRNNQKVKEVRHYYDNLPFGQLEKANLTKLEKWKNGTDYVSVSKTYNQYGLVATETDELGAQTTYEYDNFNLYPTKITNALGQTQTFEYDYSAGKPKKSKDLNGFLYEWKYDGFGRVLEEQVPLASSPTSATELKTAYVYNDAPLQFLVIQENYLNDFLKTRKAVYLDGLGRKIQERQEAEAGQFAVVDTVYDQLGHVAKQSLPYFSLDLNKTAPVSDNNLYTVFVYDPLNRVLSKTDSQGTSQNVYDDWTVLFIDPLGNKKKFFYDAFTRLVKVEEYNGALVYATNYSYDLLGNLIKYTDAGANIRNFTYDALGRRLSSEDLHAPSDTVFGIYNFSYDNKGNLLSKKDPNGNTINYLYDVLSRQKSEDLASRAGLEIVYTYDTCEGGVGKLCKATVGANYKQFVYDSLGRVKKEINFIDNKAYTAEYNFDRQGNVLKQKDDRSSIVYTYNKAGKTENISFSSNSLGAPIQPLITDINYSPIGAMSEIKYANGSKTVNTFNPDQIYRLTSKQTILPALSTSTTSSLAQDISFTYDAVGNILSLAETAGNVLNRSAVYNYDNLYRLTKANINSSSTPFSHTFSYDSIGNLLSKTDLGAYSYTIANNYYNNPHAANKVGLGRIAYDKNGNLLSYDDTVTSNTNDPSWLNGFTSFKYRKKISLPTDNLVSATGTFPSVLVRVQDADLKSVANGGKVAKDNGLDFVLTNGASTLRQNFVIDEYDPVTGRLAFRFSPNLASTSPSSTLDTFLYFGHAGVTSSYQYPSGVWSGAKLAYTFADNLTATSTILDLSSYKTHAQTIGNISPSSSQFSMFYKGIKLDGIDDAIKAPAGKSNMYNLTNSTLSFWIKPNGLSVSSTSTVITLLDKTATSTTAGWRLNIKTDRSLEFIQNYSLLPVKISTASNLVPTSTPVNIALSFGNANIASSTNFRIFINGNEAAYAIKQDGKGSRPSDINSPLILGNCFKQICGFNGILDELWIYASQLSANAIKDIYELNLKGSTLAQAGVLETYGTKTTVSKKQSYAFDYNNRLTKATGISTALSYTYDYGGDRIKYVSTSGTTTNYTMYSPFDFYQKKIVKTQIEETEHIFVNGQMLASIVSFMATATATPTTTVYFHHTDHLSGLSVSTNQDGSVAELVDYFPYGSIRIDEKVSGFSEKRKYIGQEYDSEVGLLYLNARYYDPVLGRFLSQDPVFLVMGDNGQIKQLTQKQLQELLADPQALNSYAYSRNNPLRYTDPTGLFSFEGMLSWINAKTGIGQTVDNSATYNYMVENPVQGGVIVGLGAGLTLTGASYLLSAGYIGVGISGSAATTLTTTGGTACAVGCEKATRILNNTQSLISSIQRSVIISTIENQKLQNIFSKLYQTSDSHPGGTAGAIKYTAETGKLIQGSNHIQKGYDSLRGLQNLLQNSSLSISDRNIAQTLASQLSEALSKIR